MPGFSYQAYTREGRLAAGALDARHKAEALQKLSLEGLTPFRVTEGRPNVWQRDIQLRRGIRPAELSLILRSLTTLLQAAVPIDTALRLAAGQAGTRRKQVLERLHADVIRGNSLSDAMAAQPDLFTSSHVAIVRAGELAGNIAAVMHDLCLTLERQTQMRSRIAAAIVYPAILLAMAIFALILIFAVMVPALTPLFEGQSRPMPLILTIATAVDGFARSYAIHLLVVLVLAATGLVSLSRRDAFRDARDRALLRIPLVGGIVRRSETALFARTFGTLLRNGVPLPQALSATTGALRNRQSRRALQGALEALKRGARLMEALTIFDILPETSRSLISLGEDTNRLPDMLTRVAEMNEVELESRIERLMTLLTPALTVGIGLLVGGLIMSVMNAILSANDLAI
jgi:general secretion pathway protein F